MRALLVQPEFPVTYWGFQLSLGLAGRQVSLPPLGLVTLAALLPDDWELRLVDLNAEELEDDALRWADVVLVGGMRVQSDSMHQVLVRCRELGKRTVVGGPAPTTAPDDFVTDADVVFCGEAEGRLPELLAAIAAPGCHVLAAPERRELEVGPVPRYDLLQLERYSSMSIQYSRGCPFTCEFCDVIEIFGRRPRVKPTQQVLAELDALDRLGFRGSLFFVDDNFIGHRVQVRSVLTEIARWQREHGNPFELYTEASVDLARDDELLAAMVAAGFSSVFLGIETENAEALQAAGKRQNLKMPATEAVRRITAAGIEVMGGFIVGFDQDGPQALQALSDFIADSPIPLAMVGILTALPGTALWKRLAREGRLRASSDGDAFGPPNFVPAMDEETLLRDYANLLRRIYSAEAYYQRCRRYLELAPLQPSSRPLRPSDLITAMRVAGRVGLGPRRRELWRLLRWALRNKPGSVSWIVVHAIMGEHLIRYTQETVLPRLEAALETVRQQRPQAARRLPEARYRLRHPVEDGARLVPLATIS